MSMGMGGGGGGMSGGGGGGMSGGGGGGMSGGGGGGGMSGGGGGGGMSGGGGGGGMSGGGGGSNWDSTDFLNDFTDTLNNWGGGYNNGDNEIPSGYVPQSTFDAAQEGANLQTQLQIAQQNAQIQLQIAQIQNAGETERTKYIEDNKKPLLQTEISGKLDLQKIVNAGYTEISRVERGSKMMGNITSMFNF
jgi:hypothetical protein